MICFYNNSSINLLQMFVFCRCFQAFSGLDEQISKQARRLGSTALDTALNAQFLVQIGVFTAVPMIMGFILEQGLLQVSLSKSYLYLVLFCTMKLLSFLGWLMLIPFVYLQ